MKKILSVLLTLVLLFCAVPFAFAATGLPDAVVAYGYFTPKTQTAACCILSWTAPILKPPPPFPPP